MAGRRVVAVLLGALLALGLGALPMGGCGKIGDVGYGASRAGVEPVRSTTGFSSSGYAAVDGRKQAERVNAVAKANQQSGQKTAALLNKMKLLDDATGTAVATGATPEQPTLDAQAKGVLMGLETRPSASTERLAEETGGYEDY